MRADRYNAAPACEAPPAFRVQWRSQISTETRIPRAEHDISRSRLSRGALNVLYGLKDAGFAAYLVGGSVRDLLLGLSPKDFDVATDAHPEQVEDTFRRCRLVGRRFRLAHVRCGPEIIEVATFRASPRTPDEGADDDLDPANGEDGRHVLDDSGRILRDNVYGTLEEDAFRRDFTVNALYYDIRDFAVVDYVGGFEDLRERRLRLIGDPATRYREDPVRMLRAVRFAAKLEFDIDPSAAEPIFELKALIADVPPARLFDETLKLFLSERALENFEGLRAFGLFDEMFPQVAEYLRTDESGCAEHLIRLALSNTAARIAEDRPVTPGFLFAAFLWGPVQKRCAELVAEGMPHSQALAQASADALNHQVQHVAIPRRFSGVQNEIWQLQSRFEQRRGKRPFKFLANKRFRAAYDFLCLRAEAGDAPVDLADWWTSFQDVNEEQRQRMVETAPGDGSGSRRRRRRRR